MDQDEKELIEQLRREFFETTGESLEHCEQQFLDYETYKDATKIPALKRIIHSLKGSAKAIYLDGFSQLLHEFETRMDVNLQKMDRKTFVHEGLWFIDSMKKYLVCLKTNQKPEVIHKQILARILI